MYTPVEAGIKNNPSNTANGAYLIKLVYRYGFIT